MIDPNVMLAVVAIVGAIGAALTVARRPFVALGILAILASLSRLTVDTTVGTMRLEQPAIVAVAAALIARGAWQDLRNLPRWAWVVAACLAAYLVFLGLSSLLVAPNPPASLRLVVWWAISMLGGVVAMLLALRNPAPSLEPFGLAAAAKAVAGIAVAALFFLGPASEFGIQEANGIAPRVHAFTWEANLYAGYLAASVPFGLELARRRWRYGLPFLALMLAGLPLGVTRGAYLGLAAGIFCYLGLWFWRRRSARAFGRIGAVAAVALVTGLIGVKVLLPNAADRAASPRPPAPVAVASAHVDQSPARESGVAAAPATPTLRPVPTFQPYPDTIGFRLERVPIALRDLATSPLIGMGAESYGQRRQLEDGSPDHIAILAIAVPYESGILGTLALTAAFVVLIVALWRVSRDPSSTGIAAALLASIVSMLVSYEATNALHFAQNWLVIGVAVAVAAKRITPGAVRSGMPPP